MKTTLPDLLEAGRITSGSHATPAGSGIPGAFVLQRGARQFVIIASNGGGWEHVSVSMPSDLRHTPTWEEMQAIKELFWADEEAVFQMHPPASRYRNMHPGCLHLWRPTAGPGLPLPPLWMV